ncbi:MAG: hypothetical protein AAGJ82_06135 [Bacteroidota bacterium]
MKGFEKNRNTLRSALRQMQSYEPPADAWSALEARLGEPAKTTEAPLLAAIDRLPSHTPPVGVWNKLTQDLDQQRDDAKRIRLHARRQWMLRIAAVVVLALTAGVVLNNRLADRPNISKKYTQETMQQFQLDIDWDADEGTFEQLEQQLAQLNDPTLNKLRLEYEELSLAHEDVQGMLKAYGQDPQLVRKMADIERERTDIYRQILEQMI